MSFLTKYKADFVDGENKIVLEEPLVYYDDKSGQKFVVPKGFIYDGASIPRLFWTLAGHPLSRGVRVASCLHDFLYRTRAASRGDADRMFRDALKEMGVNIFRRTTYFLAVRAFGWFGHGKN